MLRAFRIAAVDTAANWRTGHSVPAPLRSLLAAGVWLKDPGLSRPNDLSRPGQIFRLRTEGGPAAFRCCHWGPRRC
jgi:hypothetical protein